MAPLLLLLFVYIFCLLSLPIVHSATRLLPVALLYTLLTDPLVDTGVIAGNQTHLLSYLIRFFFPHFILCFSFTSVTTEGTTEHYMNPSLITLSSHHWNNSYDKKVQLRVRDVASKCSLRALFCPLNTMISYKCCMRYKTANATYTYLKKNTFVGTVMKSAPDLIGF